MFTVPVLPNNDITAGFQGRINDQNTDYTSHSAAPRQKQPASTQRHHAGVVEGNWRTPGDSRTRGGWRGLRDVRKRVARRDLKPHQRGRRGFK